MCDFVVIPPSPAFNPPDGQVATKLIHCWVLLSKSFGSFNKSSLSTYYMPDTVNTRVKTNHLSALREHLTGQENDAL